jgi:hypothetical protein
MGLLDEAIREHLELKRRSGADPGEIARAEHEALEPIFPEESAITENGGQVGGQHGAELQGQGADAGAPPAEDLEDHVTEDGDFSNTGQETAELDMQAFLDAELDHAHGATQSSADSTRPVRSATSGEIPQDSRDWGVSDGADCQEVPEEIPGQERLSFE